MTGDYFYKTQKPTPPFYGSIGFFDFFLNKTDRLRGTI
jgi:hypothetical protein